MRAAAVRDDKGAGGATCDVRLRKTAFGEGKQQACDGKSYKVNHLIPEIYTGSLTTYRWWAKSSTAVGGRTGELVDGGEGGGGRRTG
nr:hypothetical protein Itr_chr10CG15360 [Ipomoea trifida]